MPSGSRRAVRDRAVVRAVRAEELSLVGLAVYGPKNLLDKTLKGLALRS